MVVLGIAGSARKQGNSAFLLRETLSHLQNEFDTETIFLSDRNIRPCDGCHHCERNGSCRIDDDMEALSGKLRNADAIILTTPSYMGGVTSRMQALMERTWLLRKGQMAGKIGSYIVTGRRRIGMAIGVLEDYFTRLGMIKIPGVLGYAFEPGEIARDQEAVSGTLRLARDLRHCQALMDREEHEVQREND
jgi:multimeric flavodoxin WrbA